MKHHRSGRVSGGENFCDCLKRSNRKGCLPAMATLVVVYIKCASVSLSADRSIVREMHTA